MKWLSKLMKQMYYKTKGSLIFYSRNININLRMQFSLVDIPAMAISASFLGETITFIYLTCLIFPVAYILLRSKTVTIYQCFDDYCCQPILMVSSMLLTPCGIYIQNPANSDYYKHPY